jgi:two-component system sensor histidine kinase KdpD
VIIQFKSGGSYDRALRLTVRILAALGFVATTTYALTHWIRLNPTTAGFVYLVAVLLVATAWGLAESAIASVAAMLCFNFFFFPPVGTFTVADPQNWIALFAFLVTSLTASQLSARLKRQRREADERRSEMERLYALSRALLLVDPAQSVARQITHQVGRTFDFPTVALFDVYRGEIYRTGPQSPPDLDAKLREAASQGTLLQEAATTLTVTPIRLGGEPIGSLAVQGALLSDAALQSIVNLVAVALERARAQEAVNRAEVTRHSEELKSTLLDAIAHEFKTPLTSIKAVTTGLLDPSTSLPHPQRELVQIADEEADRLSHLVTEAIQLARIEGGKFHLNQEVRFPISLISGALRQMKPSLEGRHVHVEARDDLPLVFVDAELIQLVIRQLLDNALKYSLPTGSITFKATADENRVVISIADEGPGIPEAEQSRVFERFYRGAHAGSQIKGTGMGLAVAQEIVRAHGGEIGLKSSPGPGSEFYFSLPLAPKEGTS